MNGQTPESDQEDKFKELQKTSEGYQDEMKQKILKAEGKEKACLQ